MPCFAPITAYYSADVGASGKRGIVFSSTASHSGAPLRLPCGQCVGCRLERARQWAVRCMHEKQLHADNVFLTLTYDNEHLPPGGTLVKRDLQLFMKRLRKEKGSGIRFYGCGEYGSHTCRPHYHIILFNCDFGDKRYYKPAKGGERLYSSPMVAELWPNGFNVIGDVTFDSCAYVARYIAKKISGPGAVAHYGSRIPEFTVMSRRPGVGSGWFERFGEHAYKFDSVVINGREVRPPRFYDTRFDVIDPEALAVLKVKRRREALRHREDNTPERRRVREQALTLAFRSKKEEL